MIRPRRERLDQIQERPPESYLLYAIGLGPGTPRLGRGTRGPDPELPTLIREVPGQARRLGPGAGASPGGLYNYQTHPEHRGSIPGAPGPDTGQARSPNPLASGTGQRALGFTSHGSAGVDPGTHGLGPGAPGTGSARARSGKNRAKSVSSWTKLAPTLRLRFSIALSSNRFAIHLPLPNLLLKQSAPPKP
jgi:hypothetical protein